MITHIDCPICNSQELIAKHLQVCDYSITKEKFWISTCNQCQFIFTNPIPHQADIGKYYASEQYVSHSDTRKGIINQLYHYVRKLTLSHKLQLIEKVNTNSAKHLLDIGCGTGYFLQYAQIKGWTIAGYEPDETARKAAEHKINAKIATDLKEFGSKKFDVITLWHVLEHVHSLNETVEFLKHHLSDSGKIVIAVPNIESWDANYYQEKWAALDVPRHLYHFSKKSISLLFHQHGLKLLKSKGMIFDSFYVSMISEKYKNNGKLNVIGLVKAFFIGLISNLKTYNLPNNSSIIYIFEKHA